MFCLFVPFGVGVSESVERPFESHRGLGSRGWRRARERSTAGRRRREERKKGKGRDPRDIQPRTLGANPAHGGQRKGLASPPTFRPKLSPDPRKPPTATERLTAASLVSSLSIIVTVIWPPSLSLCPESRYQQQHGAGTIEACFSGGTSTSHRCKNGGEFMSVCVCVCR